MARVALSNMNINPQGNDVLKMSHSEVCFGV